MSEQVRDFLRSVRVFELTSGKRQLVQVPTGTTIERALQLMKENAILSVAVYQPQNKQYLGILNQFDIMTYCAFASYFTGQMQPDEKAFEQMTRLETAVEDLLGVNAESKRLWTCQETAVLDDLLEPFCKGVHRMLVLPQEPSTVTPRMLTQTDIVRYLLSHKHRLQPLFSKRIGDQLGMLSRLEAQALVTIPETAVALDGFRKLYQHQVTAAAVVREDNSILTTFSASDLRNVDHTNLKLCLRPVWQFFNELQGGMRPPVVAKDTDTLETVAQRAIDGHVHRVWVVDDSDVPVGVVSLTDIINQFAPYGF